jgi:SAM-dependent methyltransferase
MGADRARARELARRHLAAGDAVGWFELLYAGAAGDPRTISWADMRPNPSLLSWLTSPRAAHLGRAAIVVGCGLGDDAEELARRGQRVTAFDVAATAVDWCRRRFSQSAVSYLVADLLQPPDVWRGAFDFVLEAYTLQVLPPTIRRAAVHQVADFVAPGGTLLVIARGRDSEQPEGEMPWPLTRSELSALEAAGLVCQSFEDYLDAEDPPARRFRATYRRGGF